MRAAVFAGQGTQQVGMAASWRNDPVGRGVFAVAATALGYDLAELCARGPEAQLRDTRFAQPAVVATGVAAWAACREEGFDADIVAGHSVGEIAALVAAGAIAPADAFALTAARAELMSALPAGGAMASIIGIDLATVAIECERTGDVVVAVVNSDKEMVVSGTAAAVDTVAAWAAEAGAVRVTTLRVSHAFHSPLMAPAEAAWRAVVERAALTDPTRRHLSSVTGTVLTTADEVRDALTRQLVAPVRWDAVMLTLCRAGVDVVCQLGDDRSLCRLAKRGLPNATALPIAQRAELRALQPAVAV